VEVGLACQRAVCSGSAQLTGTLTSEAGRHGKRTVTVLLATGSFWLAKAQRGAVYMSVTRQGRLVLKRASHRSPIYGALTLTLHGGSSVRQRLPVT
jgi:hypothetical protein